MAGLWCVNIGYGRKELAEVAARQMEELPFYNTFFQTTHVPAIALAKKLSELAPEGFNQVFFAGSGSEANDTILKMIWYRSNSLGKPEKKKVISRIRGYHGVTIASASMTGLPYNHKSFDLPLEG